MRSATGWQQDVLRDLGAATAAPVPEPVQTAEPAVDSDATTLILGPVAQPDSAASAAPAPPCGGPAELAPPWLAPMVGRKPHGDPVLRRVQRSVAHTFGSTPSRDLRVRTEQARWIQQPVTTSRRILVGGLGGGVGATTVAALLSSAFAYYRSDGVLAGDVTDQAGSLEFRLAHAARWPAGAVSSLPRLSQAERAALLSGRAGRLCVLPRPTGLDLTAYWEASALLTRYFGLAVLDGGAEAISERQRWEHAHAVLVALPATIDGVRRSGAWLARLDPRLRPRVIPVLVCRAPHSGLRPGRVLQAFREAGSSAIWLGYDRSLATGGAIVAQQLSAATIQATMLATATALNRANETRLP